MPVKKARRSVKPKGGRRPYKKVAGRRRFARRSQTPEYASLSVKRSFQATGPPPAPNFALGQLYSLMNTSLSQFPRAVQVAQAYQHYRISKIAVTFKPSYDTFVAGAPGATPTKPRLYWMIDKSGSIPTNVALEGLKAMGARPLEFDENPRTIKWSPSVLESTADFPNQISSKYRISPWLSCSQTPLNPGAFVPSSVDHLGLYWFLDSIANPNGYQYTVEIEVQFQFKKPLTTILSSVSAIGAVPAQLNDSPDGIVGGHDDHLATTT